MAGSPTPATESRIADAPDFVNGPDGSIIDPTKNVLDLVRAEGKYQDYAREATAKRADDLRAAETRRVDQLMHAEARRLETMVEGETRRADELRIADARSNDALRAQRMTYEQRTETLIADFQKQTAALVTDYQKQIAAILAAQTSKDALLLSQAVDKLGVTTGERLSAVEKNQYTTGGQAAVRDPATAETLAGIVATLKVLSTASSQTTGATVANAETRDKAKDSSAMIFAIIAAVLGFIGTAVSVVTVAVVLSKLG